MQQTCFCAERGFRRATDTAAVKGRDFDQAAVSARESAARCQRQRAGCRSVLWTSLFPEEVIKNQPQPTFGDDPHLGK
jgi:hypothetical protein